MTSDPQSIGRRQFLGAIPAAFAANALQPKQIALGNRAHIVAHPSVKERLIWCFGTLLECGSPITLETPSLPQPMLAFRFPRGGSLSVEFTDSAPDEQQMRRGAWLEVRVDDPDSLRQRVLGAGLPQIRHAASNTFYFAIPGGQVFGIVRAS